MRFSTEIVLATCLSTVMAGPHHLHRHRDVHAKRTEYDVDWSALDWNNMGIDWASAYAEGQKTKTTAAPTVAPTTTASPTATASPIIAVAKPEVTTTSTPKATTQTTSSAASSSSESAVDTVVSDIKTLFSSIVGLANLRTTFGTATSSSGTEIAKIGNIGSPEASNMLLVNSVSGYDFTNTFVNTQDVAITIVVWNKAATNPATGVVEANIGSCLALTSPALSFSLAPGGKQIVAFQDDTQLGFAQATSAKTAAGAPDTTWGECNFASSGSGFDVSSIVNSGGNNYDMTMTVTENSCVSSMTENHWIANNGNPEDPIPIGDSDGSCFVPGSTMHITTKMGGTV